MEKNMSLQNLTLININRRDFLKKTASGLVLCSTPLLTNIAHARENHWLSLSRLTPQRIIGGFVFDLIAAVLVEVGKNALQNLLNGSYARSSLTYHSSVSSAVRGGDFSADNYKASVVILGVADYERYKQDKIKLMLNRQQDTQRFLLLTQYLKDEKIKIKTRNSEVSFSVGNYLEPNDLFSIEYFVAKGHMTQHYKSMEQITNVTTFKKLVV